MEPKEDLERENEKLKSQLARLQKKTSRTTPVADFDALHDEPVNGQTLISKPTRNGEEVCEICERPGHDIFTCDLLKDGGPVQNGAIGGESQGDIFCEDCEERGHTAANCPHSLDVF